MLTRLFSTSRCSALRGPLSNFFCSRRFLLLTLAIGIFSDSSLGQNPAPIPSPATEPLTRQVTESSTEIAPADRRIMSDIQEIRAMLGGGLEREFEEINQVLRQNPASTDSPAGQSPASQAPKAIDRFSAEAAQEDRGAPQGDWFSRELGQMVQARSQLSPAATRADPRLQPYREKSLQPINRDGDTRSVLRQCARQLERVAGELEQIEAYDNADAVRREANQLWEKARKSGPVTP